MKLVITLWTCVAYLTHKKHQQVPEEHLNTCSPGCVGYRNTSKLMKSWQSITDDEDRERLYIYINNSECQYFKEICFNLSNANTRDNGKIIAFAIHSCLQCWKKKSLEFLHYGMVFWWVIFCATQNNNHFLHLKKVSPNLVRLIFRKKTRDTNGIVENRFTHIKNALSKFTTIGRKSWV